MKFVGSKNKISKQIAPILQSLIDQNNVKIYFEPFVGGCNMIDKIQCNNKVGNDIHKELIALLQKVQSGWIPPDTISEAEYNAVRLHKEDYPDYYVGLVGFCSTFGSKWFGGYARGFKADKVTPRDIPNEAIRNLMAQVSQIQGIKLICKNYLDIDMSGLRNALIYCDPPYQGTTKYSTENFDYGKFYDWCREVGKTNILCANFSIIHYQFGHFALNDEVKPYFSGCNINNFSVLTSCSCTFRLVVTVFCQIQVKSSGILYSDTHKILVLRGRIK